MRCASDAAAIVRALNQELSRENPEQMFVTLVLMLIDLRNGRVTYCNAGHEGPILVRARGHTSTLDAGGGPPLCVVDDFEYEQAELQIDSGDMLLLASDGITEAMNARGELYGRETLLATLYEARRERFDEAVVGRHILESVRRFEAGAEPADDQTLLLAAWHAPR